jgi:cytochrome c-type biogenesis protein
VNEFVSQAIPQFITDHPALAYFAVFLGGVITSLGPCNLSMVPVIIGYVGGQREITRRRGFWLSLFFTLGSSLTFMLLGLVAAAVGGLFGARKAILYWLVALVCIVIGLHLLGAFKLNLDFLARLQPKRVSRTGIIGALLLGLIVGLAGSQCATPILAAILTLVMLKGQTAYGATLLFVYGLGRGTPIILAGTFAAVVKALPALERFTNWMDKAAGLVLIAIGLYFVWIA